VFFLDRFYFSKVITKTEQMVLSILDKDQAHLATTLFSSALQKDLERGKIGPVVFETYQKTGTQNDAAIALIDGVVSSVKDYFVKP
jgi:hypothetical protein